ncbi:MAG: hypothetical protein PEPC_01725 [Peptostreptococcus russellii]
MKQLYTLVITFLLLGNTLLNAQEPLTDKILIEFMAPGDPDAQARDYNLLPWPEEAKAAAYKAAEIWASYLEITVPIRVKFGWCDNILNEAQGGSTYSSKYTDDFYYPYSLLDQLLGYDKNPNVVDIICVFNSNSTTGWYFGTDGEIGLTPDPNDPGIQYFQMDFLTTALHELCHGLGLDGGSMQVKKDIGSWGGATSDKIDIFDTQICDNKSSILIDKKYYVNNSIELATALTSDSIYWKGPHATVANDGKKVKLYAPRIWSSSSISHIDIIYATTKNNLIAYNGVQGGNHQFIPGPIILGMLQDIGWSLKSGATANDKVQIEPPIKVYTTGKDIIVEGARVNDRVLVCDFSGRVRYTGYGSGSISLNSGLYIVRIGDKSIKVRL